MFLEQHWGDLASVAGFVLALASFGAALWARFTAKSAETAAREARAAVTRTLRGVDVQRAIAEGWRLVDAVRQGQYQVGAAVVPRILIVLTDLTPASSVLDPQHRRLVSQLRDRLQAIQSSIEKHIADVSNAPAQEDIVIDIQAIIVGLMDVANAFYAQE